MKKRLIVLSIVLGLILGPIFYFVAAQSYTKRDIQFIQSPTGELYPVYMEYSINLLTEKITVSSVRNGIEDIFEIDSVRKHREVILFHTHHIKSTNTVYSGVIVTFGMEIDVKKSHGVVLFVNGLHDVTLIFRKDGKVIEQGEGKGTKSPRRSRKDYRKADLVQRQPEVIYTSQ